MAYTKYKVIKRVKLGGQYDCVYLGPDSSGRPIYMSLRMWGAWLDVMERVGDRTANELDIVQGAFMTFAGGGADQSGGYHDLSSCIDTRTWDIDSEEERQVIHAGRSVGWAVWRRDAQHGGFDEHMHWTLVDEERGVEGGGAEPSASGAKFQWASYRAGFDGLTPQHSDYHWRPDRPLPVFNLKKWKDNQVPTTKEIADGVWAEDIGAEGDVGDAREKLREAANQSSAAADSAAKANENVQKLAAQFKVFRTNIAKRDEAMVELLNGLSNQVEDAATKTQLIAAANALSEQIQIVDNQVS